MTSRKAFLSVLLVFTYLLGLAHEMIPHAHHNAPGSMVVSTLETNNANHQHCSHFNSSDELDKEAESSVCNSHHHPPLCNYRTLYLPSLTHNLSASSESYDLAFFPLLTEVLWISIPPEKPVFPAECAVSISTRGPNGHSLRGPPEFSC